MNKSDAKEKKNIIVYIYNQSQTVQGTSQLTMKPRSTLPSQIDQHCQNIIRGGREESEVPAFFITIFKSRHFSNAGINPNGGLKPGLSGRNQDVW